MVSSIVVFDYFFKIKAGNYAVCVAIHTLHTICPGNELESAGYAGKNQHQRRWPTLSKQLWWRHSQGILVSININKATMNVNFSLHGGIHSIISPFMFCRTAVQLFNVTRQKWVIGKKAQPPLIYYQPQRSLSACLMIWRLYTIQSSRTPLNKIEVSWLWH